MTECSDWRSPYIAGLVDNHASITITIGKQPEGRIGFRIQVQCRIKLSGKDSTDLITEFCDDHDIAYRVDADRETTYDSYQFVVSRRDSLRTFLQLVAPYLIVRDGAVTLLCEKIIPRLNDGYHHEKKTFISLIEDIETFREKVGRANRSKYDINYFRNEWDDVL